MACSGAEHLGEVALCDTNIKGSNLSRDVRLNAYFLWVVAELLDEHFEQNLGRHSVLFPSVPVNRDAGVYSVAGPRKGGEELGNGVGTFEGWKAATGVPLRRSISPLLAHTDTASTL